MTPDHILKVVSYYSEKFIALGVPLVKHESSPGLCPDTRQTQSHAHWMCLEIPGLLETPNGFEKANRWLGFIQGVLWTSGVFSIDHMRDDNRSKQISLEAKLTRSTRI